jgi:iron complex transport system permease protein
MDLKYKKSLVLLLVVLPLVVLVCAGLGAYYLKPWLIPKILWYKSEGYEILIHIRFPRVVLALLVGASLAISGVALQGLFRNPLASPDIIGVSSGASLGAAAWIVIFSSYFSISYGLPISAFVGGMLVVMLMCKLGKLSNSPGIYSLILSGIAINSIVGSILGLITYYSNEEQLRTLVFWSMGGLGGGNWENICISLPLFILGFSFLLPLGKQLNALSLGESEAFYLGYNVKKCQMKIIIGASLLVGTSVSLSGGIGFIGLIIPHLLRTWIGADHRWLLSSSAIAGGILLLIADLLSRTIAIPAEIPVGILTSLMGGPFFLWILLKQKNGNSYGL